MAAPQNLSVGTYRHVIVAKFRDDVSQERIDELIRDFAKLPSLVPGMLSFHWGKDVSTRNKHQGFTHVFESTYNCVDDISFYYDHPDHVKFANQISPTFEKFVVVDYKPTLVDL